MVCLRLFLFCFFKEIIMRYIDIDFIFWLRILFINILTVLSYFYKKPRRSCCLGYS